MEVEQALPPAPLQTTTVQPKLAVIQEARFAQNSPGIITVITRFLLISTGAVDFNHQAYIFILTIFVFCH